DAIIAAVIATRTLADWLERFGRADVLFAPVRDFDQVFSDPLVRETMVAAFDHPIAGRVEVLKTPIRLSENPLTIQRRPPLLGEHTDEVLGAAGLPAP
ncbi:MAG: CoA transferase, partial [Burkholderiales bacterium]|nr:CoA transferase [Burkholderiales bacterium]